MSDSYELVLIRAVLYLPGDRVWVDSHQVWSRDVKPLLVEPRANEIGDDDGWPLTAAVYGFDFQPIGMKWWAPVNHSELAEEVSMAGAGDVFGDEVFADGRVDMYSRWATELFAHHHRSGWPTRASQKCRARLPGDPLDPWNLPEEVSFLVLWALEHDHCWDWGSGHYEYELNHGPVGVIDIEKLKECVIR